MRFGFSLGALLLLVVGCGGSVDQDKGTGGTGGTHSGTGGTGTGAAGGSAGSGSSAGTSGFGGGSGFGGSSGFGGGGFGGSDGGAGGFGGSDGGAGGFGGIPGCCTGDLACGAGNECVANTCLPLPPDMACWTDKDCPFGLCVGASLCPCGTACDASSMGKCLAPPDSNCCTSDAECALVNQPPGEVCVQGVCKPPVADGCWNDEQCAPEQHCIGAGVCPCDVVCGIADVPGKCQ